MSDYAIFTDSACDLSPEVLEGWGVFCRPLTFHFEGEGKEYPDGEMKAKDFYDKMREGKIAKTAAVNVEAFIEGFEPLLKEGLDVLHLGFSSGLSSTCNSARIAAEELMEKYPERKIRVVDTLAASAGEGLLLYLVLQKKNAGAALDEAADYAESIKLNLCHWFTVEDLVYLKRGGRISPMVALAGTVLGIKPILHVDNEGHLISISKVRGRKASISALADKYTELALTPKEGTVFISHGDCMADAQSLAAIIEEKHGVKTEIITYVGPVIGAHSGPGTLALFFLGKER